MVRTPGGIYYKTGSAIQYMEGQSSLRTNLMAYYSCDTLSTNAVLFYRSVSKFSLQGATWPFHNLQ